MMLDLQTRAEIAKAVFPNMPAAYLLNLAALVADVEFDAPIPTMSQKDREAIKCEIEKRKAERT